MNEYTDRPEEQQGQFPWNNGEYTYQVPYYTEPTPVQPQPPQKPTKEKRRGLRTTALALCCSLLGGVIGAGGVILYQKHWGDQQNQIVGSVDERENSSVLEGIRDNTVLETVQVETGELMSAAEVYAANVNSTVGITTSITTNFWGFQSTSAASGSGFIISDDGYILTNYHVIEGSSEIRVALYNGDSYEAREIGRDESNDIAVLKIDAVGLSPVILGDSDNTNVGDDVLAIGNPLGELTFSLTAGKISAKDREVTFSNAVTMNLMQTDCAINSGNSGGALFNMYGEVIGVTNAKYSSSSSGASIDNIGFAIPINSIRTIVESIIEKGYVSKPYVGVTVSDVAEEYQIYGLPQGASVQSIAEDSPAEKGGLLVGDIITEANGQTITGGNDLIKLIQSSPIGTELKLTVYRKGSNTVVTVTVGEKIQTTQNTQQDEGSIGEFPWGFGGFGN